MTYTTHGLMTPADIADHHALYDTGRNPECPGHWAELEQMTLHCSVNEQCPDEDLEPL